MRDVVMPVAPVRERGLKYRQNLENAKKQGRSRKGAGIEMSYAYVWYAWHESLP